MEFTNITEGMTKPPEDSVSFVGKLIKIGPKETYKKGNEERNFITLTVADSSSYTHVRSYMQRIEAILKPGLSYAFSNLLRKGGLQSFWAVSSSKIMPWAPVTVPKEVEAAAQGSVTSSKADEIRKLSEAMTCNTSSTVIGKIVQTSPLKCVRDNTLPIKHLLLKDRENEMAVRLALFGEQAEQEYERGDVLKITGTYKYRKTDSLSTTTKAKVEFLPSDTIPFDVTDDDLSEDLLFYEKPEETEPDTTEFKINGFTDAYIYASCPRAGCKNKKMKNGKCPVCGHSETTNTRYCNISAFIEHDGIMSQHTLFYPDLLKLMDLPSLLTLTDDTLLLHVTKSLPILGKAIFKDKNITIKSTKRKNDDLE